MLLGSRSGRTVVHEACFGNRIVVDETERSGSGRDLLGLGGASSRLELLHTKVLRYYCTAQYLGAEMVE